MAEHFLLKMIASKWWWNVMCKDFPECSIVYGGRRVQTPPLYQISSQQPAPLSSMSPVGLQEFIHANIFCQGTSCLQHSS